MAWRIDKAVVRGEIDNTIEGQTTGRVWLDGFAEPLVLMLDGDCWRDIAGSRLVFTNPKPSSEEDLTELATQQKGLVGDITASRKSKIAKVGDDEFQRLVENEEPVPYEWKNTLYVEWFSEANGRVLIETADYKLEASPHLWVMDEDAEEAQKLANLQAMRDFMAQIIQRREPEDGEGGETSDLDEFDWEERLKESDRLTDAYQEVLEKYMNDADCERKEAFAMGWDGLLDALADREEAGEGDFVAVDSDFALDEETDFEEDVCDDVEPGYPDDEEWDSQDGQGHPLQARAQELAMRVMDVVPGDTGPGTPAYELISRMLQVSGKLAGALNDRGSGYEPETGYVLAILKRCLNWLNEAVACCDEIMRTETDADQLAALAHIRSSAYEIRDSITELRRELK